MKKTEQKMPSKNMTLTADIIENLQAEANEKANGNTSALLRMILIKRYKL